ncbi:MAG: hypothetical protein J7K46_10530 [Bacteroidales bacterium]|nr:hypothetical protein [Bacteroidales bacterium]
MKTSGFLPVILLLTRTITGIAQPADSSGFVQKIDFIGTVFSHFRTSLNADETAFDVTRAYLGFDSHISRYFSVVLILDIGSPEDLSESSGIKRYAFFKNAALKYKKDQLAINFGIIDMLQFKVQEKFWAHRYIYKSFLDEYRFGSSADIGAQAIYRFNDRITGDLTFSNGEGSSKLQIDNFYKTGIGISLTPSKKIIFRTYYSFIGTKDVFQNTISLFAGCTFQNLQAGGEFNYQFNTDHKKDRDKWGYSAYALYNFSKKWQVFGRWDWLTSSKLNGNIYGWNYTHDGSSLILGIQFSPVTKVNIALDYRDWYPYPQNPKNNSFVFLNLEYKI